MKNILFLTVFLVGIFSTSATTGSISILERNCSYEAAQMHDFIYAFTDSKKKASKAADNIYEQCIEDGGSSGGVVDKKEYGLQP